MDALEPQAPVDVRAVSRLGVERGELPPRARSQAGRNSSKTCAQADACRRALSVSTPSRSKRQARIGAVRPSICRRTGTGDSHGSGAASRARGSIDLSSSANSFRSWTSARAAGRPDRKPEACRRRETRDSPASDTLPPGCEKLVQVRWTRMLQRVDGRRARQRCGLSRAPRAVAGTARVRVLCRVRCVSTGRWSSSRPAWHPRPDLGGGVLDARSALRLLRRVNAWPVRWRAAPGLAASGHGRCRDRPGSCARRHDAADAARRRAAERSPRVAAATTLQAEAGQVKPSQRQGGRLRGAAPPYATAAVARGGLLDTDRLAGLGEAGRRRSPHAPGTEHHCTAAASEVRPDRRAPVRGPARRPPDRCRARVGRHRRALRGVPSSRRSSSSALCSASRRKPASRRCWH